jgi:lipoate-protein ligase B
VEGLLEVARKVGQLYEPQVEIRGGAEMGVWTPRGKFAAVGVHVEQGVLLHGLAVNGFRTSQSFVGIRPCGLDAPVDFLLKSPFEPEFSRLGQLLIQETIKMFWSAKIPDQRLTVSQTKDISIQHIGL